MWQKYSSISTRKLQYFLKIFLEFAISKKICYNFKGVIKMTSKFPEIPQVIKTVAKAGAAVLGAKVVMDLLFDEDKDKQKKEYEYVVTPYNYNTNNIGYTTKEVADILGISEYTVRQKIRDDKIIAEKIPGVAGYRISSEALEDYISKKKRKPNLQKMIQNSNMNNIDKITDFNNKIENILDDSDEIYDIDLLKQLKNGKETVLNGLKLRLQMLQLDKDDSNDYKKKELSLKISINDLETEIKAYDIIINSVEKAEKNES